MEKRIYEPNSDIFTFLEVKDLEEPETITAESFRDFFFRRI